jgi:response regulator RpfG family c-di-GMP phosphodiesterase
MLVEDNPGDARLVVEALRDAPELAIALEHVESLASALERASRGDIDVVLLDLGLPDSEGLATLERFRAHFPHIPVVALTGLDDPDTALSAVQSGAQDFLVKGRIDGALLARAARYAVERHRLLTRVESLHQETARRLRRLSSLRAIDLAITASFDLRLTLGLILDHVIGELAVDAASVLLLDPASQELEFALGRGFMGTAADPPRVRLGDDHAGLAALDRRLVVVPHLADAPFGRPDAHAGEGFVSYAGAPLVAKGQVKGVLQVFHRSLLEPEPEWLEFFETLAGQAAIAVDNFHLFDGLEQSNLELTLAYDSTLEGWSRALDLRDKETEGHTQRVTEMTVRLARRMGLSESEVVQVRRGALLHDIGKMGIPDRILLKPGSLTAEEWEVMRRHPKVAYDLLWPISYLRPALDIPYAHHEKWDGSGYPRGLAGEAIPLAARLFAIADVWDALSSDRPYRPAWPAEKVRAHIAAESGKHFDPRVVRAFQQLGMAPAPPAPTDGVWDGMRDATGRG